MKIHESTTHYLEPEKFLIPMFRKVTGSMFELAKYYENYWRNRDKTWRSKYRRECFSKRPIPVKVNIEGMRKSFETEFIDIRDNLRNYLPDDIIASVENIVNNGDSFNEELWSKIVYHHAAAYKNLHDEGDKYRLLDSLKTLWLGRFVRYAEQVKDMDINEAEWLIQQQAEVFEKNFDYFKSIY
ncbi:MAG TPA: hypothetical protein ENI44_05150 [Thermoplasmatales archaeon]|nr:hypothetical protein [Thermoplasmatales archaeon]